MCLSIAGFGTCARHAAAMVAEMVDRPDSPYANGVMGKATTGRKVGKHNSQRPLLGPRQIQNLQPAELAVADSSAFRKSQEDEALKVKNKEIGVIIRAT